MDTFNRRAVLKAFSGVFLTGQDRQRSSVPWSSGIEAPRTVAPANATDCHHHIYDSRFPADASAKLKPADAPVSAYRLLQKRLGATRHVIVQPSTYGVDNRCMLDALRRFGVFTTRGVAVVNTEVSEAELKTLQAAGICGIRFNLIQASATTMEMIEPLAKRAADLDWHIQLNVSPAQILTHASLWQRLRVPLVFDHLAHIPSPDHPAFAVIANLLASRKCWVKLSGFYMDTKVGPPTYSDRRAIVEAFIKEAPELLVWGSDWPHPTTDNKPDDAILFDLLHDWCPGESIWKKVLVDNPATLYGFKA